jgi:uncharacterized membrane protein
MAPSRRLAFIDLLRGWAVIVMIETHVVNATIQKSIAATPWFEVINFINGLVAPTFLFASGMAFAVTSRRKLDSYLSVGTPLLRQVWRLLFILILAYILHLPKFNVKAIMEGFTERQYLVFLQADVLHCIAVSLLFLQALLFLVRTEKLLYRVAGAVAATVLFVTPFMWGVDWLTVMPAPLAAYMNGMHFSLFPVFPWMVFILAGTIAGYSFTSSQDHSTPENRPAFPIRPFATVGAGLIVLSFVLIPLAWVYPTYDYWRYSPAFVLLRLGIVMTFAAAAMVYELNKGVSPRSLVTMVGRESLLIYTVHLMLIYGDYGSFNFRRWSDHTFTLPVALMWTVVLLALMFLLAMAWDRVRKLDPKWKLRIQRAAFVSFVIAFIVGPVL